MSKAKKLPKYVTEARMASLLARFARAADAEFAVKLAAMEGRLRAEFGGYEVVPPYHDVNPMLEHEIASYEGNHLAPSTHEGEE